MSERSDLRQAVYQSTHHLDETRWSMDKALQYIGMYCGYYPEFNEHKKPIKKARKLVSEAHKIMEEIYNS